MRGRIFSDESLFVTYASRKIAPFSNCCCIPWLVNCHAPQLLIAIANQISLHPILSIPSYPSQPTIVISVLHILFPVESIIGNQVRAGIIIGHRSFRKRTFERGRIIRPAIASIQSISMSNGHRHVNQRSQIRLSPPPFNLPFLFLKSPLLFTLTILAPEGLLRTFAHSPFFMPGSLPQ